MFDVCTIRFYLSKFATFFKMSTFIICFVIKTEEIVVTNSSCKLCTSDVRIVITVTCFLFELSCGILSNSISTTCEVLKSYCLGIQYVLSWKLICVPFINDAVWNFTVQALKFIHSILTVKSVFSSWFRW